MNTDTASHKQKSLYELRESAKMRPQAVAETVTRIMGLPRPLHWTSICQIEDRGTNKSDLIDALAIAYGVHADEIKAAAKVSRISGRPDRVRRAPKKTIN